jgi:electron transfer flavoprotein alpha subunit
LPIISRERCTSCGLCVDYCPTQAVELVDGLPVITIPDKCAYCGLCEETCPVGAISLEYEIVLLAPSSGGDEEVVP